MQFSEAIMEYSFDCKIRKLSAKTIENYQKQLRYHHGYELSIQYIAAAKVFMILKIQQFSHMTQVRKRA